MQQQFQSPIVKVLM